MFINIARAVEAETTLRYTFPGMKSVTVADPGAYIYEVFTFALGIVGIVALGFLVYGGIRYILSAGNPSALADAKSQMLAALIGIVLLLSSYLILNTLDPRLLQLTIKEIAPVTPGEDISFRAEDISFRAIEAMVDDIARLIKDGNTTAAKALYESQKLGKISDLRKTEGVLASRTPEEAAILFAALDAADQATWILRATQNRPGSPSYDPSSEYYYSRMIQRVPVDTLIANYWKIPRGAQEEFLGQLSDTQRVAVYWKFNETQQETYMSQLSADHLARIYQNFQADGVHGAQLARQIATTERDSAEASREVVGVWKRLRPGAERELFLKQVKQAGWGKPINDVIRIYIQQASPGSSEDDAVNDQIKFAAEFARQ